MRTIRFGLWILGSAAIVTLLASGCGSTCSSTDSCGTYVPPGGTGGTSTGGVAGSSGGSGGPGGVSAGGSASGETGNAGALNAGAAGEAGESGAGGAAPCSGACSGSTPVCNLPANACVECLGKSDCHDAAKPACDASTNTCVECTAKADCTNVAKPLCDTTQETCVACLQQNDCASATASACNAGQCQACTMDADCSNIPGKGVCNAGTCVQCTSARESVCSGKSCNPATNTCTMTTVNTVDYCQPCVADSECIGGDQADPDARCVPMSFMGVARTGGFCLKRVAKTCTRPYEVALTAKSLSGVASEDYCGIDQEATRCEAVLDLVTGQSCADGKDTSCGCARNSTGACIGTGQGGLCKLVGVSVNQCTIPCATAPQCPTTLTCTGALPYCH
jgi:hypothetical protein